MQGFGQSNLPKQSCQFCRNYHSGQCHRATGACFGCGQPGHFKKYYFTHPVVSAPSYSALSLRGSHRPSCRGLGKGVVRDLVVEEQVEASLELLP